MKELSRSIGEGIELVRDGWLGQEEESGLAFSGGTFRRKRLGNALRVPERASFKFKAT